MPRKEICIAVMAAIAVNIGIAATLGIFSRWSVFGDPDEFMRAFRVLMLMDGGAWFEPVQAYVNPPYGLAQHWTRFVDLVVLAGAWPLSWIVDKRTALEIWGTILPVALYAAMLAGMTWSVRPWFSLSARISLCVLFFAQVFILAQFHAGRIDHNPIFLMLLPWIFGCALRVAAGKGSERHAVVLGLLCSLAVWASVEALVMVAAAAATGGLAWFFRLSTNARPHFAFGLSLSAFLTLFAFCEAGPGAFASSFSVLDRISAFHAALAWCLALMWLLPVARPAANEWFERFWWARALLGCFGILLVVVLVAQFQAQLLEGRVNSPDALYNRVRVASIGELRRAFSLVDPLNVSGLSILPVLITAVPGLTVSIWRLCRGPAGERILWVALLVFFLCYFRSGVIPLKYAVYYQVLFLVPIGFAVGMIADRLIKRIGFLSPGPLATITALLATIVLVALPMGLAPSISSASRSHTATEMQNFRCSVQSGIPALKAAVDDAPSRLLSVPDFSPAFLYAMGPASEVMSIPNHRYQKGFELGYRAFNAARDKDAAGYIRETGADIVLLCPNRGLNRYFGLDSDGKTFASRVYTGISRPEWLIPLPLTDEATADGFKAWRIEFRD